MLQVKKIQVINPQTQEKGYTFRQVNRNKVDAYALAANMQESGSLTEGDAINATLSLPKEIAKALANNGIVTIKGFGTFELSTKSGWAKDAADLKKSAIRLGINFTPADEVLDTINRAEIKVVQTATVEAPDTDDTDDTTPTTPSEGNQGNVMD